MKQLKFRKEDNSKWYVVLPGYPGPKADLQMVAGADTMLNIIAGDGKECMITVSDQYFEGAEVLTLVTGYNEEHGDYILEKYQNETIGHKMWLCPVVTYVFKKLPRVIYFRALN